MAVHQTSPNERERSGTCAAPPNPSLNTPTRYGRQRKPGLWLASIFTVRAYAAYLRGRG
jgi:hypothetical protein